MRRRVAALLVVFSMATGAYAERTQWRGRGQERIPASKSEPSMSIVVGFGIEERHFIVDWFHDSKNLNGPAPRTRQPRTPAAGPARTTGEKREASSWAGEEARTVAARSSRRRCRNCPRDTAASSSATTSSCWTKQRPSLWTSSPESFSSLQFRSRLSSSSGCTVRPRASAAVTNFCRTRAARDSSNVNDPFGRVMVIS